MSFPITRTSDSDQGEPTPFSQPPSRLDPTSSINSMFQFTTQHDSSILSSPYINLGSVSFAGLELIASLVILLYSYSQSCFSLLGLALVILRAIRAIVVIIKHVYCWKCNLVYTRPPGIDLIVIVTLIISIYILLDHFIDEDAGLIRSGCANNNACVECRGLISYCVIIGSFAVITWIIPLVLIILGVLFIIAFKCLRCCMQIIFVEHHQEHIETSSSRIQSNDPNNVTMTTSTVVPNDNQNTLDFGLQSVLTALVFVAQWKMHTQDASHHDSDDDYDNNHIENTSNAQNNVEHSPQNFVELSSVSSFGNVSSQNHNHDHTEISTESSMSHRIRSILQNTTSAMLFSRETNPYQHHLDQEPVHMINTEMVSNSQEIEQRPPSFIAHKTQSNNQYEQFEENIDDLNDIVEPSSFPDDVVQSQNTISNESDIIHISSQNQLSLPNNIIHGDKSHIECPICLEQYVPGDSLQQASCHHRFHTECLIRWLEQQNTCPICRVDVFTTIPISNQHCFPHIVHMIAICLIIFLRVTTDG